MRLRIAAGLLVTVLAVSPSATAAELPTAAPEPACGGTAPSPGRPRVGLVLSGGGALGLAHVGVLRALEEMHVPVDCIAGTSMGAIVGGLYAAGYSPAELDTLVRGLDWSALVGDAPERRRLPYRRKVDDQLYLTRWEIGVERHGFELPPAVVAGHRLGLELGLLALRAAGVRDFDRLPLPFRAMATDAADGSAVVLAGGDLATALRASMAVPALFAPVEREGRLLVDGGMVANLPVAAAREMGAEVIVAVDLGETLATLPPPDSIGAVLSRTLGAQSRRAAEQALATADVAIRPDVHAWGLLDFDAAPELVARGEAATRAQLEALRRFAVSDDAWAAFLARQRRRDPGIHLRNLVIEPGPGLPQAAVRRAVRSRSGRTLDPATLAADVDALWHLGGYQRVDFTLTPAGGDEFDLRIVGRPKPWGPNLLRTGLSLVSDLEGTSGFNLLAGLHATGLSRSGTDVRVTSQIGETPVLALELYQPVAGNQVPFLSLGLQTSERKTRLPALAGTVQYRTVALRATAEVGVSFGRWGEARFGYRHGQTRSSPFGERPAGTRVVDRNDSGLGGSLVIDQLDRLNFPRRGVLVSADFHDARRDLGADLDWRRFDLQLVSAATAGRNTLLVLAHGRSALGGVLPPSEWTGIGGLFNVSGFPAGEVTGSYGGSAALLYLYRLGRMPRFGEGLYVGVSLEAGGAWATAHEVDSASLEHAFAVVFGADTLLGPVYVAHGRASGGRDSFYLYVGRTF